MNIEKTVTYEIKSNGKSIHFANDTMSIPSFKAIAIQERNDNPEASIECFRNIDGVYDGTGHTMRLSQKGDAVIIPKGHTKMKTTPKVIIETPKVIIETPKVSVDIKVGDRIKLHDDGRFTTPCVCEVNENDVVLQLKYKGREIGRTTITNVDLVKMDTSFRGATYSATK